MTKGKRKRPETRKAIVALCAGCILAASELSAGGSSVPSGAHGPPGTVVAHSPHVSGVFFGSPSLLAIGDGVYLASHDTFGPNVPSGAETTRVYRSDDAGENWEEIGQVAGVGLHWANLFMVGEDVYLFGANAGGDTVILRSEDFGLSWTEPVDEESGLLLEGTYHPLSAGVLVHDGRVWRANEYSLPGVGWGQRFEAFMMSAPVDADLLRRESWTSSNRIGYNGTWLDGRFGGWLEGNAVVTPAGEVVNILRVQFGASRYRDTWAGYDGVGKAAIHQISEDGEIASFDAPNGFVEFPGGLVRFQIQRDPETGHYWSLSSFVPPIHRNAKPVSDRIRNTVALVRSEDLYTWEIRSLVLYEPDPARYGFQYLSWEFDGDDLVALSRTSYPDETTADASFGIDQAHDSNYLTFHRFRDFRTLRMEDSAIDPLELGMDGGNGDPSIQIVGQPEDQDVQAGGTASFVVEVETTAPVEYKWTFVSLAGSEVEMEATNSVLVVEKTDLQAIGHYYCEIREVGGSFSVESRRAYLSVSGASGLVGQWKLDEIDPDTLTVGNAGLIGGGGQRTSTIEVGHPAPVGSGYLFDGIGHDDVVSIGSWPGRILNTTNQLTYSAWIKPTFFRHPDPAAPWNTRHNLISLGNPREEASFLVSLQPSAPGEAQLFIWVPHSHATSFTTQMPEPVKVGEFTHIAVTRAESGNGQTAIYVYVNGTRVHAEEGLPAGNFQISDHPNYLGRQHTHPERDFDGVMSDVGLWSGRALSAREIALLGGLGRAGQSLSSSDSMEAVLALFDAGNGAVTTGDWTWTYTTEIVEPEIPLSLGRHFVDGDGRIFVVLGGSDGNWEGVCADRESLAGYRQWVDLHFSEEEANDTAVGGPRGNPMGDGVVNLLKYAFGADPHVRASSEILPRANLTDENLTITYRRKKYAPDIDYFVEVSGDLKSWVTGPEVTEQIMIEGVGDIEEVTEKTLEFPGKSTRRFIRVGVRPNQEVW